MEVPCYVYMLYRLVSTRKWSIMLFIISSNVRWKQRYFSKYYKSKINRKHFERNKNSSLALPKDALLRSVICVGWRREVASMWYFFLGRIHFDFPSRGWYLHKMEVFKIKFTVIILFYLTAIAISKELEIYRTRLPGEDGWRIGRDSFKIPPSLCNQGIKCTKFSAFTERQCFCKCPNVDATFLLDNNDWRCSKNERVRRLLGK